ncbi:MAG: glycosyltransferase family 4 protein [Aquificaceae bacterium]
MRLLILNRRCIRHPERGGAEVYAMELARAVVESGGSVEWFSSKPKGLKGEELIEGIRFIRRGNQLTTHLYGFWYALRKPKDWIILDVFNGLGFFTFAFKNSLLLVHQLYREYWVRELGPLGYIFLPLEEILLWLYKERPTITVSPSTQEDLRELGFKNITIIYNGLDTKPLEEPPEKEKSLTLLYLGRLKSTKNPEDAIKAFLEIKRHIKEAKLYVVGGGPLERYLTEKYSKLEGLEFTGYLEDSQRDSILRISHFLLVPSVREGWGQVVLQANAFGTVAIGYRVKGLKDSIREGITGFLVKDHKEMAQKVIDIWQDKELYKRLSRNAFEFSKNFSWEETKKEFLKYLKGIR